ncbi:MAG: hypothetical protein EXR74_02005 [Bdellovibrionales bacterium]|nr:hypothetical protein [Bdellovibrionales bacterium]
MQKIFRGFFLCLVVWVLGCSRPPSLPVLENFKNSSSPEIALRNTLTVQDIRKIFEALNTKGNLNGIKNALKKASSHDLEVLGSAINRYLYQEALNSDGLPSLLEARILSKTFSTLNSKIDSFTKNDGLSSFNLFLRATLTHSSLPNLLSHSHFLFDSEWTQAVSQLKLPLMPASSFLGYNSLLWPDITKAIHDPSFEKEVTLLTKSLQQSELGKNIFFALHQIQEEKGGSAFKELSESLLLAVSSNSKTPSVVTRWLTLAKVLNQSSSGLFLNAQEFLKTETGENLVRLLAERFEPMILGGVSGFLRETIKDPFDNEVLNAKFWLALPRKTPLDPPTPNFIHLFNRIQFSMEKMANGSRPNRDPAVTLNSFLLVKWFEEFAKANVGEITQLTEIDFQEAFWTSPIKPFFFTLNLLDLNPEGKPKKDSEKKLILSPLIDAELKLLGLEEFSNDLKLSIKQENFGPTLTKFATANNASSLKQALTQTIVSIHRAHPFADPVPLIASIGYLFTRPSDHLPLTLADLETPNMLNSIQVFMKGVSFHNLRKINRFLFEDLQIGTLSQEDRKQIKSLYATTPESAELLDSILQTLQVIYELDAHAPQGLSLLEFYHYILMNSRNRDMKSLTAIFSFLNSTKLFEVTESKAKYPSIIQGLSQTSHNSVILEIFAGTTPKQEQSLLLALNSIFANKEVGVTEIFSFFRDVIVPHHKTISSLVLLSETEHWNVLLSSQEQDWIKKLLTSEAFPELFHVLVDLNDSQTLFQMASDLQQLQQHGDLRDVFKVLSNIKSDRMQRLALVLWKWEQTRELGSLFSLIKNLTKS